MKKKTRKSMTGKKVVNYLKSLTAPTIKDRANIDILTILARKMF